MPTELRTMTEEKISQIKSSIKKMSMRKTALELGVSYYTVWCVKNGRYDEDGRLDGGKYCDRDVITGMKLRY